MIKKFRTLILTAASMSLLLAPALVPTAAFAASTDISGNICKGVSASATTGTDCSGGRSNSKISNLFASVINLFSLLVGIVAVIMIIIGGFQYILSNGDSSKISTAKNTIIFALVGLIIVAMAQFIVRFVLGKLSGATGA